jgi:hypothetical protein
MPFLIMVFWAVVVGLVVAAVFKAAGWERALVPVAQLLNFLSKWSARALIVLIVGVFVWVALHWSDKHDGRAASVSAADDSATNAPTPEATPPPAFDVTMDLSVTGGTRPVVTGKTNLPDGTRLIVLIDKPWAPDAACRVGTAI